MRCTCACQSAWAAGETDIGASRLRPVAVGGTGCAAPGAGVDPGGCWVCRLCANTASTGALRCCGPVSKRRSSMGVGSVCSDERGCPSIPYAAACVVVVGAIVGAGVCVPAVAVAVALGLNAAKNVSNPSSSPSGVGTCLTAVGPTPLSSCAKNCPAP